MQLEARRASLAECSYIAEPKKWMKLFADVKESTMQLSTVINELRELERKLSNARKTYLLVHFISRAICFREGWSAALLKIVERNLFY